MRAILTSVDYSQELRLCLPYNRHHFSEVWVVTSPADTETQAVARECGAKLHVTDAFYRGGAEFAKYLALEEGLDAMGREGWLTVMDADVLWPRDLKWGLLADGRSLRLEMAGREWVWSPGHLITPYRRMMVDLSSLRENGVPHESAWQAWPLHRNRREWPGYSQTFAASDPHLGPPPWHDVTFRTAGAADSLFQQKWPASMKVRPPFECLHLGPSGENWCGRASELVDGTVPPDAEGKRQRLRSLIRQRVPGPDRFRHEKLP